MSSHSNIALPPPICYICKGPANLYLDTPPEAGPRAAFCESHVCYHPTLKRLDGLPLEAFRGVLVGEIPERIERRE